MNMSGIGDGEEPRVSTVSSSHSSSRVPSKVETFGNGLARKIGFHVFIIGLLVASVFRISALSSPYLITLTYLLCLPSNSPTLRYTSIGIRWYACCVCLAQLIFQIVLGSTKPYASSLDGHQVLDNTLNQIGFIRFDVVWHAILLHLLPEVIVFVFSFGIISTTQYTDSEETPSSQWEHHSDQPRETATLNSTSRHGQNNPGSVAQTIDSNCINNNNIEGDELSDETNGVVPASRKQQPSVVGHNAWMNKFSQWFTDRGIWLFVFSFLLGSMSASIYSIVFFLFYATLVFAGAFHSMVDVVKFCRPLFITILSSYIFLTYAFQFPIVNKYLHSHAPLIGLFPYMEQYPPSYHARAYFHVNEDLEWPFWVVLVSQYLGIILTTSAFRLPSTTYSSKKQNNPTNDTLQELTSPLLDSSFQLQQPLQKRQSTSSTLKRKSKKKSASDISRASQEIGNDYTNLPQTTESDQKENLRMKHIPDNDDDEDADDDDDDDLLSSNDDEFEVIAGDEEDWEDEEHESTLQILTRMILSTVHFMAHALAPVVQAALNHCWLLSVGAQFLWAFLFPSWFGLVMIAWTALATVPSRPNNYFRSSVGLLIFSCAIILVNLVFYLDTPTIPQNGTTNQFGLRSHATAQDIARALALRMLCLFAFGITTEAYLWTSWKGRKTSTTSLRDHVQLENEKYDDARRSKIEADMAATEGEENGNKEEKLTSKVKKYASLLWSYVQFGWSLIWNTFLRYVYLVTVLIVYIASLEEVTVFNAIYLFILILFVGFPSLRESYWVILVAYCTIVIFTNYIWGFPFARTGASSVQIIQRLFGLDPEIHKDVWGDLRYHIAILSLSLIQLFVYRFVSVSKTTSSSTSKSNKKSRGGYMALPSESIVVDQAEVDEFVPTSPYQQFYSKDEQDDLEEEDEENEEEATHCENTQTPSSSGETSARKVGEMVEQLVCRFWVVLPCVALFLSGTLGHVVIFRLVYLVLLGFVFVFNELGFKKLLSNLWYLIMVISAIVIIAKYSYQFEDLRKELLKIFSQKLLDDVGFKIMEKQLDLFVYLLPSTFILISTVVQTRLQALRDNKFVVRPLYQAKQWYFKILLFLFRLVALHVDKAVIATAFASSIFPSPNLIDVLTVTFMGLIMVLPQFDRIMHFSLLCWMIVSILAKLFYQLHIIDLNVRDSTMEWFGFTKIPFTPTTPLQLVQWEVYVIVALIVRRYLRNIRAGQLWPKATGLGVNRFYLFDEPHNHTIEDILNQQAAKVENTTTCDDKESCATATIGGDDMDDENVNDVHKKSLFSSPTWIAISFFFNHFMRISGMYVAFVFALVVAIVRSNAFSLFYLVVVALLLKNHFRLKQRTWRTVLIVQLVFFLYQFAASVGIPPHLSYPWDKQASAHYELRALLRWIFLPPYHVSDSTHEPEGGIIERAPASWHSNEVLYWDFIGMYLFSLQLPLLSTQSKMRFQSTYQSLLRAISSKIKTIQSLFTWLLPWVSLLLMFLIPLSRLGIFSILYLIGGFWGLSSFVRLFSKHSFAVSFWNRVRWYSYAVLFFHILWVLPAVLINWSVSSRALLDAVQFFGIRFGMDTVLLNTDRRTSPWSSDSGLLFDFLLFITVAPLCELLRMEQAEVVFEDFATSSKKSRKRAHRLPSLLKASIDAKRRKLMQRVEMAKQLITRVQQLSKKQSANGGGFQDLNKVDDHQTALWFTQLSELTSGIKKDATGLIPKVPSSSMDLIVTDAIGNPAVDVSDLHEQYHKIMSEDNDNIDEISVESETQSSNDGTDFTDGVDGADDKDKSGICSWLTVPIRNMFVSMEHFIYRKLKDFNILYSPLWEGNFKWSKRSDELLEKIRLIEVHEALYKDKKEEEDIKNHAWADLGRETYHFLMINTHIPCYLFLIVNVLVENSFLAVLLPLFYFLWGGLARPVPSIFFWKLLTWYTIFAIGVKYMFQFNLWGHFNAPAKVDDDCHESFYHAGCLTFARFFGIWRYSDGPEFLFDLVWDCLLLLTLFIHRLTLHSLGLWNDDLRKRTLMLGRRAPNLRVKLDKDMVGGIQQHSLPDMDPSSQELTTNSSSHSEKQDGKLNQGRRSRTSSVSSAASSKASTHSVKRGLFSGLLEFYRDVLRGTLATPRDYYIASFLCEFVSFIVICFGWSGFRKRETYTVSTAALFQQNNIPSGLLLYLLFQFILIIVDRALYLTRSIRAKLFFHFFVTILVHFLVFFWIPYSTLRSFSENSVVIVLYLLKVLYLFLSAAQIQATYPLSVQRNIVVENPSFLGYLLFLVYRAIPFLYELRMLLDWSCVPTTLHLQDWYRIEDISGQLFMNLYTLKTIAQQNRKHGQKQPLMRKLTTGALLVILLVFILWLPLLLISLVNDRAIANTPSSVELSVRINTYEPMFVMDSQTNFSSISTTDYQEFLAADTSGFANDFRQTDIQRTLLSPQSKSFWTISPSSRSRMQDVLSSDQPATVGAQIQFTRQARDGVSVVSTLDFTQDIPINSSLRADLVTALLEPGYAVNITNLFPSVFHLDHRDSPQFLPPPLNSFFWNCSLIRNEASDGVIEWWTVIQNSPHIATATDARHNNASTFPYKDWLEVISLNDRVVPDNLSFISSYGIVGLYVSVVLVIGRFLRLSVDNVSHNIIFEKMPQVLTLQAVLDSLYLARESGDLTTEENIFHLIIKLYRSPSSLIRWTSSALLRNQHQPNTDSSNINSTTTP
eukprot:m.108793 g.108793  ORF g.108793 m.108793 type:complete len:2698 (-) comp9196_c0_seq2:842-8935(-)